MKIKNITAIAFLFMITSCIVFTSCYTVYDGGASGIVKDKDSGSGINGVDVYGYISAKERDADLALWEQDKAFVPTVEYYGHTTTDANGSFTLSKMIWKKTFPKFGKDADYTSLYIIYYHKNYGAVSGDTIIVSDTISDCVNQELESLYQNTVLTFRLEDIASSNVTDNQIYVKVTYPTIGGDSDSEDSVITGTGTISIRNRKKDKDGNKVDKNNVSITYYHSSDTVAWKGCHNDTESNDYTFYSTTSEITEVNKDIPLYDNYSITLYGKTCKLSMPVIEGSFSDGSGKTISFEDNKATVNCTENKTTKSYTIDMEGYTASTSEQYHGNTGDKVTYNYNNLGSGKYWYDYTYDGKFVEIKFTLVATESVKNSNEITVYSNENSHTVSF